MNGYYPYGTNYYSPNQPMPQSGYGYNNQNAQQPQPQQQLKWYAEVDGIEGAKSFRLNPGTSMLLMDKQAPICYRKQTNQYGDTIIFEIYDLVLHEDAKNEKQTFITKEEFEKEIGEIRALFKKEG